MVVGKIPVSSGRAIRIPVSSGREIKIRISVPIREAIIPTNGNAAGNQSPRFKAGGILLGQSCFKPGSHGGFTLPVVELPSSATPFPVPVDIVPVLFVV